MTLRCVFHVSPATTRPSTKQETRPRIPSVIDIDVDVEAEEPRGASYKTIARARGWVSED